MTMLSVFDLFIFVICIFLAFFGYLIHIETGFKMNTMHIVINAYLVFSLRGYSSDSYEV